MGNGKIYIYIYIYIIFFIKVDLWLILFFKVENSGGMGDVLESTSFMKKILSIKVIDWEGCQGVVASARQQTAYKTTVLYVGETLREMGGKWGNGKHFINFYKG